MDDLASPEETEKALVNFAEAVIENLKLTQETPLEAFEGYEIYLRGEIHKNKGEFIRRFVSGYFAINPLN